MIKYEIDYFIDVYSEIDLDNTKKHIISKTPIVQPITKFQLECEIKSNLIPLEPHSLREEPFWQDIAEKAIEENIDNIYKYVTEETNNKEQIDLYVIIQY